jgi:diguanylate cyclase (GGDEF)-like protein
MLVNRPRFRLLAAFQSLAGLAVLLPALIEPSSMSAVMRLCAAAWLTLAGINWLFADRLPQSAFDLSLFGSSATIAVHVASTPHAQMQVLDGLELLILGMFATFALSERGMTIWLSLSAAAYLIAWALNPEPIGLWLGAVVILMVAGTTTVVRRMILQVRDVSRHDPLTGALNRWGLVDQAQIVQALSQRSGAAISVAFLDLNGFKRFNDEHGHLAGDRLLIALAQNLQNNLRATDLVARVGGDEFVLILPGVDSVQAAQVIDRLQPSLPIEVTYGVADWHPRDTLSEVIEHADQLMYQRKPDRLKNRLTPGEAPDPR